jgi:hypothetical protein
VGVPEPLLFDDGLGARMDRREIRPGLAEVRDQTLAQRPFDRLTRLGGPAGRQVAIRWACLVDPCGGHAAEPRLKAEGLGFVPAEQYMSVAVVCLELRHVLSRASPTRMAGRGQPDGYIRETFSLPREQARAEPKAFLMSYPKAAYVSEVERWRELPDIEFTMRRLRTAD